MPLASLLSLDVPPVAVKRGYAIGTAVVTVNRDIGGLLDRETLATFMSTSGEDVAR